MKCSNCGNEMTNNELFCDNCGQKAEIHTQINQKRYCGNCGAEVEESTDFCGNCGYPFQGAMQTDGKSSEFCGNCGAEIENGMQFCGECGVAIGNIHSNENVSGKHVEKKRRTGIVIAVISVVCIAAAAGGVGYMIYPRENYAAINDDISVNAPSTAERENKAQALTSPSPLSTTKPGNASASDTESHVSNADGAMISNRTDLYDSTLTYKRMSDIHNTVLADDKTFIDLKSVIEEFDKQCEDYMNEITDEVPSLLKPGTTAYNQQVEYKKKHPTLNQSYQNVDVINARQGGGYYYVWVTEVMNVNENGTAKVATDHWVYRIENDNGSWYICDYTADPAF